MVSSLSFGSSSSSAFGLGEELDDQRADEQQGAADALEERLALGRGRAASLAWRVVSVGADAGSGGGRRAPAGATAVRCSPLPWPLWQSRPFGPINSPQYAAEIVRDGSLTLRHAGLGKL